MHILQAQFKDLIAKLDDAQAAASERNRLIERVFLHFPTGLYQGLEVLMSSFGLI